MAKETWPRPCSGLLRQKEYYIYLHFICGLPLNNIWNLVSISTEIISCFQLTRRDKGQRCLVSSHDQVLLWKEGWKDVVSACPEAHIYW